jgi:hypothetical protein
MAKIAKKRNYRKKKIPHARMKIRGPVRNRSRIVELIPNYAGAVIPRHHLCNTRTVINGYVGSGTTNGVRFMTVNANSLASPFNTGQAFNTAGVVPAFNATMMSGDLITQNPSCYTVLASLYQTYRILNSRIKVICQPQNVADPIMLTVLPFAQTTTLSFTALDMSQLQQQPYAKFRNCGVNNVIANNIVEMRHKSHDVLGLTKRQYLDNSDIGASIGIGPATDYAWSYLVAWETINNSSLSGQLNFTIELECGVLFSNPQNMV